MANNTPNSLYDFVLQQMAVAPSGLSSAMGL
jgi:hypothetical protein